MQESYLQHMVELTTADLRLLMETYGQDVWNYAYVITKNAHMADDIAQEVFIKAYRNFASFRGKASVKTWLLKITRNTALSYRKLAFFRKMVLFGGASPVDTSFRSDSQQVTPSAEAEYIAQQAVDDIWHVVFELPQKFRDPLVLSFHYGLSMDEIAAVLSISTGTVKSRIYRAKRKLAAMLKGASRHE